MISANEYAALNTTLLMSAQTFRPRRVPSTAAPTFQCSTPYNNNPNNQPGISSRKGKLCPERQPMECWALCQIRPKMRTIQAVMIAQVQWT